MSEKSRLRRGMWGVIDIIFECQECGIFDDDSPQLTRRAVRGAQQRARRHADAGHRGVIVTVTRDRYYS